MIQAAVSGTAPTLEWANIQESEHFVQFYEQEPFLLDSLSGYIGGGLRAGDRCIVVATKSHRASLEERLQAAGHDMAQAIAADQYVSLDAAETLSRFMVDGEPDPGRFRDVIGSLLLDRTGQVRRTRVFGEMVALLWAERKQAAAAQLEAFWNDLGRTHRFSLFCAYPMSGFHGEGQSTGFSDICCKHSSIIPTESYAQLSTMAERRKSVALLQQRAMSLELEVAERKRAEQEIRRLNDELNRKVDEYKRVVLELEHSRATLSDKLRDLEIFHDVAVNRELKMMALEKELDAIKGKCNA